MRATAESLLMSDIGDSPYCGTDYDSIFARRKEAVAVRTMPTDGSEKFLHPTAGLKRQLVAALDLVHRAVELVSLSEERAEETELQAQEFEELMQRTFQELQANKARCEQLEARVSEWDARAREADKRALLAEEQAARAQARAAAAETHAAEAEARAQESERWRARVHDVLHELVAPLAAAPHVNSRMRLGASSEGTH
jgi:chromosome segregation ATPase